MLGEPRKVLASVTFVVAILGALFAFAYSPDGSLSGAVWICLFVVLLAAFAARVKGRRGWIYLVIGWVLCIVAWGALPPIPYVNA